MRRSSRDYKELDRIQKLRKENETLKKRINQLQKQLQRIDLEEHEALKNLVEKHYKEDEQISKEDLLEKLKQEWKCRECTEGYLEIILFNKIDTKYYYRKCSNCNNRTKSQKYDPSTVKGIVKNDRN